MGWAGLGGMRGRVGFCEMDIIVCTPFKCCCCGTDRRMESLAMTARRETKCLHTNKLVSLSWRFIVVLIWGWNLACGWFQDCICSYFCGPCVLSQMMRHSTVYPLGNEGFEFCAFEFSSPRYPYQPSSGVCIRVPQIDAMFSASPQWQIGVIVTHMPPTIDDPYLPDVNHTCALPWQMFSAGPMGATAVSMEAGYMPPQPQPAQTQPAYAPRPPPT